MRGAHGAYSIDTRTIYLSSDHVLINEHERDALTGLTHTIIEEIGHFIDGVINHGADTPGDEGELFAANVMGLQLSTQDKRRIIQENDHSLIDIEGRLVAVEQSIPTQAVITLTTTDPSAGETTTGTTPNPGRFTLTRTGDATRSLSVSYTLAGSATKGSDYVDIPGTAAFAAGSSTTFVDIRPIDDSLAEGNETVTLTLAAGSGYSLGSSISGTVTIADNDNPIISVAATDAEAGEVSNGARLNPGRFTLSRTGDHTKALVVTYNLSGTASKNSDYISLPGTAVFAAGSGTAFVDIRPFDDSLPEGNETVVLSLAAGKGYSLGSSNSAVITILDNEPSITVTATDATAEESALGTTANPGRFSLTRTGDQTKALTVAYTLSGTATKGTDYVNLTGTASFAAGSTTAFVDVKPIDDNLPEGNETVVINLVAGTGYSLGSNKSASITIADNEKPVITIAATDPVARETLTGAKTDPGRFTLTRLGNLSTALTINYVVSGTAIPGKDYNSLPGRVTFSIGSSTAFVNVNPIDDLIFEANEAVTLTVMAGPDYTLGANTSATVTIWNTSPGDLADYLWDNGTALGKIALNLKSRGFGLLDLAEGLKWGVTKIDNSTPSYSELAAALWNPELINDPRVMADLLWDKGASQAQIGQAMKHVGFGLDVIASSVKQGITNYDGLNLNYIDTAIAIWNSGYGAADGLDSYKLADLLWENGASAIEIGQSLKYIGLSLEAIAGAVKWGVTKADGTNLEYHLVAEALWNSGYTGADGFNSRKLADLLWDVGASQQKIGQSFDYLKLSLETLADAILEGVTQSDGKRLNHFDAALALWNSGYGIDSRKLADLLWDEGIDEQKIGQTFKYLGLSLANLADAIDDGITLANGGKLSYNNVALGLWNSGYSLDTRSLAGLLWNEGASQQAIGQAIRFLGFGLDVIADALDDGPIDFNYIDVTLALWYSGHAINTRQLAGLLWNEGIAQGGIGQAIRYLGYGLDVIADAMADGPINFNSIDVAIALWNCGLALNTRNVAGLLWNEGFNQGDIGQAIRYLASIGRFDGLTAIADAMMDGPIDFNHVDTALALWKSGYSLDTRQLAGLLWNEGVSQGNIGAAIKYLGYGLDVIADAMDDGPINFNHIDVTLALWNSGYALDTRQLAGLLWNEGIDQSSIGKAIRYLGYGLDVIADAMADGPISFNSIDTAIALWNSGHSLTTRNIAGLLWNEGYNQGEIGQAIRVLASIGNFNGLAAIADAMVDGPIDFNHLDTALALWNSGYAIDGKNMAALLWNEGIAQAQIGQALRYLGFSKEQIGFAVKRAPGVGLNYVDAAIAVWNSGHAVSDTNIANIVRSLGGGVDDVYSAVLAIGAGHLRALYLSTRAAVFDIGDWFADAFDRVTNNPPSVYDVIRDSIPAKIIPVEVVDFVLLPYELPTKIAGSIVDGIVQGDLEIVIDGLKRIPVLGTAVGILEGVVRAIQGNEKETLISAIDSALAFYGTSNIITPKMVEFTVDIFWELKDSDYKGAIASTLENLGLQKSVSDLFVDVAWSMSAGSDWKQVFNAALSRVGFMNATSFTSIAWSILDQNYREALRIGLDVIGLSKLGIDQAKANAFLNLAVAIQEGKFTQAADVLVTLSGNNPLVIQSSWIKDLRDGNSGNDRQAIQLGLSYFGFKSAAQWTDALWSVKDGQHLQALGVVMTLGNFAQGRDWTKIIEKLQQQNYAEALSVAFGLAGFKDGQALANAVIAVKNGKQLEAFYASLGLIEGGRDLAAAFKYLIDLNLQGFSTSMVGAAPVLAKYLL